VRRLSAMGMAQSLRVRAQQGLRVLARLITTYARTVLVLCLALAGLASLSTVQQLEFVAGRNDLASADKRYVQLDEEYAHEFGGLDQLIVVVEPRDVQQGKEFVSRLGERLAHDTAHVEEVFYRIDTSSLEGKKLLYLSPADLHSLHDKLGAYRDVVQELVTAPGLNTLFRAINQQMSAGMASHLVSGLLGLDAPGTPPEATGKRTPLELTFLTSLLRELRRALDGADYRYHSPWADFFGTAEELTDEGYLLSDNRRFLFVMVEPKAATGFNEDQESIAAIRQAVAALRADFPGLAAGVTGTTALNNDEMLSAQDGTRVATVVSFIGVTLLYVVFFQKLRHPLLIVSALMIGLSWTMGFVTLTVGHLTVLTVFIAPMLLGLADDFGVHFLARYEEERGQGRDPTTALRIVFEHTVPGITAGAVTTALAFFAVMLADFRGVQELGWITGGGLLLSLLATLTFLPALVVLVETHWPWEATAGGRAFLTQAFAHLGAGMAQVRGPILTLAGVLTLAALAALPLVSFDYNLLHLQARGTESVTWEERLLANSGRSSWSALAAAPSPAEAVRKAAAFATLPAVESVESVASLIPEGQDQRLERVRALPPLGSDLPPTFPAPAAVEVRDLQRTLDKLRLKLRAGAEWDPQKKPAEPALSDTRQSLLAASARLQGMSESEARAALERFQHSLLLDFQNKWVLLRNNLTPPGPITLADVPAQLKNRFVSKDGTQFLLQIYPKKNIWDRAPLEAFITQLRQVDPEVTGSPVIGYESIRAMQEGYVEGGLYALVAVLVVTFFTLRGARDTVLAMLPLGLGVVWTAGGMWLFDLQFNLANLIAVPLIIGIGVENGLHLVHRCREEGEGGAVIPALVAGSTGQAVALFSLTTMVGFGSLMVAAHYGVFSMGLLLMVAVGSVLAASLIVLPLLLSRPSMRESGVIPAAPTPEGSGARAGGAR